MHHVLEVASCALLLALGTFTGVLAEGAATGEPGEEPGREPVGLEGTRSLQDSPDKRDWSQLHSSWGKKSDLPRFPSTPSTPPPPPSLHLLHFSTFSTPPHSPLLRLLHPSISTSFTPPPSPPYPSPPPPSTAPLRPHPKKKMAWIMKFLHLYDLLIFDQPAFVTPSRSLLSISLNRLPPNFPNAISIDEQSRMSVASHFSSFLMVRRPG
ncbi:unnamed protein product [Darwinula stevensoni]|uniref:Uncharacterized protein n=1 Tax=Darwinula stevensoni TaxID=69355 RepID=A0A7R8XK89_9CRUS|nr:unnamed protein product [Darwinula stevensoni]CAG0896057.1 unnamed protein product [Darwinula stevensoni]